MNRGMQNHTEAGQNAATALETKFPFLNLSVLALRESWRKELNRPLYHIHKWWATRLGSVFRAITLGALVDAETDVWEEFYQEHRLSDRVVLDPFMGSGTTLGEALKLGVRAIGCDVNPISTFLVRQAFTRVPEAELCKAFKKLENEVAPKIRRYYQTRDPETGELIPVLYFFWCKTVQTPAGETVPLFPRYIFAQHSNPRKQPLAKAICSRCGEIIECRYDATSACCQSCGHSFNPQSGPAHGQFVSAPDGSRYKIKELMAKSADPPDHQLYAMLALRSNGEKVYLAVQTEDRELFASAEDRLRQENLPLPTMEVRSGHNTDQARGYNYTHWRDFFNGRQLLCLGLLLRHILQLEDQRVQEQLLCLFSSTLEFNNMFCSYKGEGTGAVRHMFSHHILKPERMPLENSVWGTPKSSGTFSTLFVSRLLRAKKYLDEPFEIRIQYDLFGEPRGTDRPIASRPISPRQVDTWAELQEKPHSLMILNGSSSSLPIPDSSIDAIVTDPPYFDFVHYSELSDFFFAWLSPVLSSRYTWMARADCSHEGEVQHNNPRVFSRKLARVFAECQRVLKPEGVLAFSFHHSRVEGWIAIHRALREAGLEVVATHPVRAEMSVSSPKNSANEPISLDAILVCRKQRGHLASTVSSCSPIELAETLAAEFASSGLPVSCSDKFIIAAAQTLVEFDRGSLSDGDLLKHLLGIHSTIKNRDSNEIRS